VTSFHKKPKSVDSNGIGMKFCWNVLNVNTHRLMESYFRFDLICLRRQPLGLHRLVQTIAAQRQFPQAGAAAWQMKRTHRASAGVRQFLIFSTFVHVS